VICLSVAVVAILTCLGCRFLYVLHWGDSRVVVDKKWVFIFFFEKGFAFRKN
jgi:hypothetical protein